MSRNCLFVLLLLCFALPFLPLVPASAETATEEGMEQVCRNWLSYIVHQTGGWAGSANPEITAIENLEAGDMLLARCYSIRPCGHVIVPVLKELPPIKAHSEEHGLDVNQTIGFPQLLRKVLSHRIRLFVETYGCLDAAQPATGDVLFERQHREAWERLLVNTERFAQDLPSGESAPLTEVGPLVTTLWHQRDPFNQQCPMGDGGRCLVGNVVVSTAQIMKFHDWPPHGISSHSYSWDGDQSCDGDVGGGILSGDFSDSYDWANMPDDCEGGCSPVQEDALAELCYELGVGFETDYGACGSSTADDYVLAVLPTFFRYDASIDREDRDEHTADTWFDLSRQRSTHRGRCSTTSSATV